MESLPTVPVTATWCPSCPFRASWLSTARTFWSASVTITIFSPPATHFFVHASAPALAPFTPHFASLTHPLTVVLFPISSNAKAVRANTKQLARQSTRTFLMAGFSPFLMFRSRPQAAVIVEILIARPAATQHHQSSIDAPNYTTGTLSKCHTLVNQKDIGKRGRGGVTSSPSDWPVVAGLPEPVGRTRTPRDAHSAAARALLSRSLSRPSSTPESAGCRARFRVVPARSAFAAIHTLCASVCRRSCHSRQT